jgi:pimeloyl-ACP methyl ester carboxylesterase
LLIKKQKEFQGGGKSEKESKNIMQIFEERKKYIPEVGEQLADKKTITVEAADQKLEIDYRIIKVEKELDENKQPVLLLPGFGSGWEGIAELGFSLACEGREVILPSLPGYGNSSNPNKRYYQTDNYDNEAIALNQLLEQIKIVQKVHLIGHSMGSEVITSMAVKQPNLAASLTLLNPSGVRKKESPLLPLKFVMSGIHTSAEYNIRMFLAKENDYEKGLYAHIPDGPRQSLYNRFRGDNEQINRYLFLEKTKNEGLVKAIKEFAVQVALGPRGEQRIAEAKKLNQGQLLEKLSKIDNIPIILFSGEFDSVNPMGEVSDQNSQLAQLLEVKPEMKVVMMAHLRHNTTLAPDEIVGANIDHLLTEIDEIS